MNIYIDKQNLLSYVKSTKNESFAKCNEMLKEYFSFHFSFSKMELAHVPNEPDYIKESKDLVMSWITNMNSGVRENAVHWKSKVPSMPWKEDTLSSFTKEQLSSVYWLDNKDISEEENSSRLIVASVGNEISSLQNLMIKNYNSQKQIKKLKGWSDINGLKSPCTDIILIDRFIMSSPEIKEFNLYALLQMLCTDIDSIVNIIIFTDPQKSNQSDAGWKKIICEIKSFVKQKSNVEPNVTIALSSNLGEHDRELFTNYKSYQSGDSFNYFDSNGNVITKGRFLNVYSLVDKEKYENWLDFVDDMQSLLERIDRNNPDMVKGDRKSYYLKFPQHHNIKAHSKLKKKRP